MVVRPRYYNGDESRTFYCAMSTEIFSLVLLWWRADM
jgi:hypothetical protein